MGAWHGATELAMQTSVSLDQRIFFFFFVGLQSVASLSKECFFAFFWIRHTVSKLLKITGLAVQIWTGGRYKAISH